MLCVAFLMCTIRMCEVVPHFDRQPREFNT